MYDILVTLENGKYLIWMRDVMDEDEDDGGWEIWKESENLEVIKNEINNYKILYNIRKIKGLAV
jgi:hypothetical protein